MKKEIIIKAIKNHVKDFNGIDLKSFYEELGFDDVYTADDSYMDYFKSKDYLESHITDCERTKHLLDDHGITIPMDDNIEYIKDTLISLRINSLPIREDFKNRVLKVRDEAVKMADAEAFLGVIVFVGSMLEGILVGILLNTDNNEAINLHRQFVSSPSAPDKKEFPSPVFNNLISFVNQQQDASQLLSQQTFKVVTRYNTANQIQRGKENNISDWKFKNLLDVARNVQLFDSITSNSSQSIRDARNFIHLNKQVEDNNTTFEYTSSKAKISVNCLEEVVNSLYTYFINPPQTT